MRLTEINENKTAHFYPQCFENCGGVGYSRKCDSCDFLDRVCNKLGEYEDLEERCVKENSWGLRMLLQKWKEFIEDIQSLYEYRKLEEQKKLLKLPCTVGDTVYHLCTFGNGESEIIEMKVGCVEPCGSIRQHNGVCEIWNVYAETDCTKAYFRFSDFNKTVFPTKESAEAALKKMSE